MQRTLYQHCTNVLQRCFDVVSTSGTDVVSTLCDVENPTSDFVSFSTSDQRYFNVDPQRWNNVDPTLKCWLGSYLTERKQRIKMNDQFSSWLDIVVGVPILGPLLFNIFLCDIFLFCNDMDFASYADNNTPYIIHHTA